jgi:hypothetical protein
MVWFLSIVAIAALVGLTGAMVWAVHEILRSTAATRLERSLHPRDVLELNQAFARVQRDVLYGD